MTKNDKTEVASNKWIDFIQFYGLIFTVAFSGLVYANLLADFTNSFWVDITLFSTIFFGYLSMAFLKFEGKKPQHEKIKSAIENSSLFIKVLLALSFGLICTGLFNFHLPLYVIVIFVIAVIIGPFLYARKTFFKLPVREIPFLKAFAIGLSWAIVVYIFPMLISQNGKMEVFNLLEFGLHAIFIGLMSTVSDGMDVAIDDPKLKTFPQILSNPNLLLCQFMVLIGLLIPFITLKNPSFIAILLALSAVLIFQNQFKKTPIFGKFIIDCSLPLYALLFR